MKGREEGRKPHHHLVVVVHFKQQRHQEQLNRGSCCWAYFLIWCAARKAITEIRRKWAAASHRPRAPPDDDDEKVEGHRTSPGSVDERVLIYGRNLITKPNEGHGARLRLVLFVQRHEKSGNNKSLSRVAKNERAGGTSAAEGTGSHGRGRGAEQ